MNGYSLILKIRNLEDEITKLGLRWRHAYRHNYASGDSDQLELVPLENCLPIYSRDAAIFVGTIEELDVWLAGVTWARSYDRMLRVSDDKRRSEKETRYLEAKTFSTLQGSKNTSQES